MKITPLAPVKFLAILILLTFGVLATSSFISTGDVLAVSRSDCDDIGNEEVVQSCKEEFDQCATDNPLRLPSGGPSSAREDCQNQVIEDAEAAADSAGTEDTDCQGGGALGWILCPVFELGANVTSDAFENVIKPMLENVPVSANRNDPFYKAWSNFRLIGNIILVGAMLVLVYGQLRGGGGR